ncbi:cytidine deaminase [Lachnospiraceae bacterium C10]|jgi:cytidine deaminase|nr:cytidine deaminase [Lachnospiraceae bacterium]SCW35110.1 cytidine deaminase [Lachnospiraceae bacterium C10]SDW21565.1 cytidine deaminase [Lachnospiraceae bacterium KHCPX20]
MTELELCKKAHDAMEKAYVPYSRFRVGAALLTKSGKVYTGCNIENASYGATNCAERTAIFKAVSEGEKEFEAIAITGGHEGDDKETCTPCGICRQVISEFCDRDFRIFLAKEHGTAYDEYTLEQLLPAGFALEK